MSVLFGHHIVGFLMVRLNFVRRMISFYCVISDAEAEGCDVLEVIRKGQEFCDQNRNPILIQK